MSQVIGGTWVLNKDSGAKHHYAFVIDNNMFTEYRYSDKATSLPEPLVMNPQWGTFYVGDRKFIVRKAEEDSILLISDNKQYKQGNLSWLGRDPDSESYQADLKSARRAADRYISTLQQKHRRSISYILTFDISCSGDYYFIDCEVFYSNASPRKGEITVRKNYDGTFEATGLELE